MRHITFVLAVLSMLAGCTKQGLVLSETRPTERDVAEFNARNSTAPTAMSAPAGTGLRTAMIPAADGPRVIIIGNVMALTAMDAKKLSRHFDDRYGTIVRTPGHPLTRDWYLATGAGATAVKIGGVTGLYTRSIGADVPSDLVDKIRFASAFWTMMVGTSGDLVAVENSAYGIWVTRLLCGKGDPDYSRCAARYRHGSYQAIDGREIDATYRVLDQGSRIDRDTYQVSAEPRS